MLHHQLSWSEYDSDVEEVGAVMKSKDLIESDIEEKVDKSDVQ